MTVLLIKCKDSDSDVDDDANKIQKAIKLFQKAKGKQPLVLTIEGYDVYCIPGTLKAVEPNTEGQIKLDFDYIFEVCELENQE